MYQQKTLIVLGVVVCQWMMVTTMRVGLIGTNAIPEEVAASKDHRNTLLDLLDPGAIRYSPGDPKLRSKRRDMSYFKPIASVKNTAVIRLVFQVYLNIFRATLKQGKPPLQPKFPRSIITSIKEMLLP